MRVRKSYKNQQVGATTIFRARIGSSPFAAAGHGLARLRSVQSSIAERPLAITNNCRELCVLVGFHRPVRAKAGCSRIRRSNSVWGRATAERSSARASRPSSRRHR